MELRIFPNDREAADELSASNTLSFNDPIRQANRARNIAHLMGTTNEDIHLTASQDPLSSIVYVPTPGSDT